MPTTNDSSRRTRVSRARWAATLAMSALAFTTLAITAAAPSGPGPFARARECARCHLVIHEGWLESAHARAATSPGFTAALAGMAGQAEAIEACAACHAPTVRFTHDVRFELPISREGITCDFCHTVTEVRLVDEAPSYVVDPGPLKRGPFLYTESPWHETGFSPLFRSGPLLCAGCHEHRNPAGVAILTTWSEWKGSAWAGQGVSCQDCHMPLSPGATAEKAVGGRSQRLVNVHRIIGGMSRSWIHHGLDLAIDALGRRDGAVEATVLVRNAGAGHRVPGGLPGRRLVLIVGFETTAEGLAAAEERSWGRVLVDAQGRPLEEAAAIFLRAAGEGGDTRLRPGETRSERFRLVPPAGAQVLVARLEYRDASNPDVSARNRLVSEVRRNLPGR